MWSSRICTICSQMLYWGLMLLWVHVHLGKRAMVSRTGHGFHSDAPGTAVLFASSCARDAALRANVSLCRLSGVWGLQELVSHSAVGTLPSAFSLNVSAPSILKAALHVGTPWLFPRPSWDKLSGKDDLQRPTLSSSFLLNLRAIIPLEVIPQGLGCAAFSCKQKLCTEMALLLFLVLAHAASSLNSPECKQ